MNTYKTIARNLFAASSLIIDETESSKFVSGNRNYTIIIADSRILFAGTCKECKRRGFNVWKLTEITERHMHFYDFTYKKDFERELNLLQKLLSTKSRAT